MVGLFEKVKLFRNAQHFYAVYLLSPDGLIYKIHGSNLVDDNDELTVNICKGADPEWRKTFDHSGGFIPYNDLFKRGWARIIVDFGRKDCVRVFAFERRDDLCPLNEYQMSFVEDICNLCGYSVKKAMMTTDRSLYPISDDDLELYDYIKIKK